MSTNQKSTRREREVRTAERRAAIEAATRREQKRRNIGYGIGAALIAALLVLIGFVVVGAVKGGGETVGGGKVVAPARTVDGAFQVGDPQAPVTVDVYYDYMCPACGAFESVNEADLDDLMADGTANVNLRPISFLDRMSRGTEFSTRAANAFATVADQAPDTAWDFHSALYANQPAENTPGLSDEQIADIAEDAGVPAEVIAAFTDGTHRGWVAQSTEDALKVIEGTPTVKVDGKVWEGNWAESGALRAAVEDAADAATESN